MRSIICTMLAILFYHQSCFADVPVSLYVSTGGSDTDNPCTNRDTPCRTVKNALDTVVHDGAVIHIVRGTYDEESLWVRPGTQIIFAGGWDSTFSRQTCDPAGTTIVAGHYPGFDDAFLEIFNNNNGENSTMDLRCLTLEPAAVGGFNKVISIITNGGATGHLSMDHVEVTGFAGNPVVGLYSQINAQITATINDTAFVGNDSNEKVIDVFSQEGSTLTLDMEDVRITGNFSIPPYYGVFYARSIESGSITATATNSIIASNTSGIELTSSGDSHNSLTLTNCTIVDNPRFEIRITASNTSESTASMTNAILRDEISSWTDIYLNQLNNSTLSLNANYCILGAHQSSGNVTYNSSNERQDDPMLDGTWHLQKGSPAIDTGLCGTWFDDLQGHRFYIRVAPSYDIDGDSRPGFGEFLGCDIGADEYKFFSWPMFVPAMIGKH